MTIATVMVCLALDQSNQARMEVAGQLAERFQRLAGMSGQAEGDFGYQVIDEELIEPLIQ